MDPTYSPPSPKRALSNRKLAVISIIILLSIALVLLSTHHGAKPKTTAKAVTTAQPPASALNVVSKYLQAREDAAGADQTSPTSWLAAVQPISTKSWFTQLQPTGSSSASSVPYTFTLAHQNGYTVKASAQNCIWTRDAAQPTTVSGTVSCSLYDVTYVDGLVVGAASLPFGWPYNGQQPPAVLKVVKQGTSWLVDGDLTGTGS